MMSKVMIEVNQLTKRFKANTAVREVNVSIKRGEIFGLIGQNGAGKSTLLKLIGGLMHSSSGSVHLFSERVANNHAYFERIGILIEEAGLYREYSAYENMNLSAISYGLKDRKKRIKELLELVGLSASNKKKVKNYSMGMKQRLGIAIALMGSPDVLILDEPINGLDPQGISDIRTLLLELNKAGMTIIISSHILEELSKVATKYAIIHHGEIIEVHSKEELLAKCEDRIELEVDEAKRALPLLEQLLAVGSYKVVNEQTIHIYDPDVQTHKITKVLVENDIAVHSIMKHKQSLEQYFLEKTGSEVALND